MCLAHHTSLTSSDPQCSQESTLAIVSSGIPNEHRTRTYIEPSTPRNEGGRDTTVLCSPLLPWGGSQMLANTMSRARAQSSAPRAVEEERKQGSKARPRLLEAWLSLQALLQWYRCRTAVAATINAAVQGSSTTALARGHSLALDSSFAEEIFLSTTTSKLAVGC